jgi:hypothetical protein
LTPTRVRTLVAVAAVAALVSFLVARASYTALPVLPVFAPVSLVLLVVVELGMAKVVRDRVQRRSAGALGRPPRRPLHPISVARAAALAKASSVAGALLGGAYAGIFAWAAPRRGDLPRTEGDALVAGVSTVACVALVVAALLLERACRVPPADDGPVDAPLEQP